MTAGDIKPSNFVFVKGQLKLIDFGIAILLTNSKYAYRDNQIGTVSFSVSSIMQFFISNENVLYYLDKLHVARVYYSF